jgi:hypothetical protein
MRCEEQILKKAISEPSLRRKMEPRNLKMVENKNYQTVQKTPGFFL